MVYSLQKVEEFLASRKQYGIKPGLERMERLLTALGNPEKDLSVIHISGTNGKGSTANFIQDVLLRAGYGVGFFTSPSFTGVRGHFIKNKREIKQACLVDLYEEVKPIVDQLDEEEIYVTEFEILTAIAFLYFKEKTDLVIVEAGMGGRYDTTNVVDPILSIITTIALDHTQFLGETLEEIAYHKAGIIKEARPVLIGPVVDPALQVLLEEAAKNDASTYVYGDDFTLGHMNGEDTFTFGSKHLPLRLGFVGTYQKENIATAIAALYVLEGLGYRVREENIVQAMKSFSLPGRFEKISDKPIIILDSAHNLAGIAALKASLQAYYPERHIHCLFAVFKDKAGKSMINSLSGKKLELTLTTFDHERAASLKDLDELALSYRLEADWKHYMKRILQLEESEDVYVITGSMHFIMAVRWWLQTDKESRC